MALTPHRSYVKSNLKYLKTTFVKVSHKQNYFTRATVKFGFKMVQHCH
jgi:hypothetical protein